MLGVAGDLLLERVSAMVPNGTYTIEGKTKHVTVRFRSGGWGNGKQVVSYLYGSDNTRDFEAFGHIDPATNELVVWRNFREGLAHQKWCVQHLLGLDPVRLAERGYAYALASSRCYRCGRELTVPASIHRGMGPECAAKVS